MDDGKGPVDDPIFDPSRCQWCGEEGFDLRGLANHVWTGCEIVESLAQQNIDAVTEWHHRSWEAAQKRRPAIAQTQPGDQ